MAAIKLMEGLGSINLFQCDLILRCSVCNVKITPDLLVAQYIPCFHHMEEATTEQSIFMAYKNGCHLSSLGALSNY